MRFSTPIRRSVALAVTLTVLSVFQSPAQDGEKKEKDEKKIDPKAMEVMDRVVARYSGASSITGDATMTVKQTLPEAFGGGNRDSVITHTIARKGAQFSQRAKGETEMPVEFYVDGSEVTLKLDDETAIQATHEGGAGSALESADFGYQKEAGANMILDQHMPAAFMRGLILNSETYPWTKDLVALTHAGDDEVDGIKADKLTMTMRQNGAGAGDLEINTDVWISKGEDPMLLRVRPDMSAMIKQMAEQDPQFEGMKIEMNGTFSKPVLDGEIAEDVFKPELGDDVKTFASFAKLIEEMQAAQGGEGGAGPDELVDTEAPDFELNLLDGEKFKLSENKDKVVILDFWATWCGPCVQALPVLMKVSGGFADKGVKLIAVNQQEDKGTVSGFIKKKDWKLTVAMDKDGKVGGLYKVRGIPQTVIVGKDGKVKKVHVGFSPGLEETLTGELKELTAE